MSLLVRRLLRRALLVFALTTALAVWLVTDLRMQLMQPMAVPNPVVIQIKPGSRLREVSQDLYRQGVLMHRRQGWYLELYARAAGEATAIKTGEYQLQPGMSPLDALQLWLSGKTVNYELRIVEGTRFEQALTQLMAHPAVRHTLAPGTSAEAVMQQLGKAGQHPEGRLFPDTYLFPRDTSDIALLKRALTAMDQVLADEWLRRKADLPYSSPDQALTMASIVEKETAVAAERTQIAGVFVRRLMLGMKLQTDPTVIYGLGEIFDGNLRKRDLQADNPYNTYMRGGLPPSPICLPGRAAITAALQPAEGESLYFVSRGDGTHQFSRTLDEHLIAVRRYQLGAAR